MTTSNIKSKYLLNRRNRRAAQVDDLQGPRLEQRIDYGRRSEDIVPLHGEPVRPRAQEIENKNCRTSGWRQLPRQNIRPVEPTREVALRVRLHVVHDIASADLNKVPDVAEVREPVVDLLAILLEAEILKKGRWINRTRFCEHGRHSEVTLASGMKSGAGVVSPFTAKRT